jgi:hypothetical protein
VIFLRFFPVEIKVKLFNSDFLKENDGEEKPKVATFRHPAKTF